MAGLDHGEVLRQGVIRYHPAGRKEWREERKKMAVLENDWDDSVTSCLCGKKGERTEKRCLC